jgi:hypothetical protein
MPWEGVVHWRKARSQSLSAVAQGLPDDQPGACEVIPRHRVRREYSYVPQKAVAPGR